MVDLSPSQSAESHHQNDDNNAINSMMGNDKNDASENKDLLSTRKYYWSSER